MEVALGVGSLVVLAGGLAAVVRRAIRPGQAAGVLGIAASVALVAGLAQHLGRGQGFGGASVFLVIACTTVAGIAMAVAVVTRPPSRLDR